MRQLLLSSLACLAVTGAFARGQDSISPETVAAIKSAAVYVKVPRGDRMATGSGWVMKVDADKVFVVTNNHVVLDAETPHGAGYPEVTAVFRSGTKQEQAARAEVVAMQKDPDLAVLRVSGVKDPPPAIDFTQPPKLAETMPVVVFGFPFTGLDGVKDPPVTVTRGAVSSIRGDDIVQLDTNLNPGNSGGPVVDVKGRLVGIAFARPKVVGRDAEPIAGIGLAIPAAAVTKLAEGLVAACVPRLKDVKDGTAELEVEVRLIDPLERVKTVSVVYAQAEDLAQGKAVAEVPGAARAEFPVERQKAAGLIKIKAPKPGVFLFYCQASCLNGAGKYVMGSAQSFHVNFKRAVSETDTAARKAKLVALEGRTGGQYCLAFSPTGKLAATGGESGRVRVWDMAAGWKADTLPVPKDTPSSTEIKSVAFSPDGKLLAASAYDTYTKGGFQMFVVWNVADRRQVWSAQDKEESSRFECIVFSPDGKTIAAGGLRNRVKFWDAATGRLRERLDAPNRYTNEGINGLAFSPDGKQLATAADDGAVRVWDVESLKEVAALRGENGEAKSVAWSPDGTTLAVGYEHGSTGVWHLPGRKLRELLKSNDRHGVTGVAFSSDGTLLATAQWSGDTVMMWQVASGKPLATLKSGSLSGGVAFSPDDRFLAATRSYTNSGYLMVWNVAAALAPPEKK